MKKRSKKAPKARKPKKPATARVIDWRDVLLTTDDAGAVAKMSGERIRQLTKLGWIKKVGTNSYRLGDVIDGVLAYRDDLANKVDADSEQSKLAAARRREIDLRIARETNQLVEADDVLALVTDIAGGLVAELRGVPAGSSRDPEVRAAIEENLNGALDRCRVRFEKLGADLRSGRGVILEGEDADT